MAGSGDGNWWYTWDTTPEREPVSGVHMRAITGDQIMVTRVALDPASVIPVHDHPHEQVSVVLDGSLEMTVEHGTRRLGPGDVVTIPGGARHGVVVGPAGATVMDVFSPPREDYRS